MTIDDRVSALRVFRLTERQARFVVTAALHGGYFLRRQYLRFTGRAHGKNVVEFLDGLVARKLATRIPVRADRGHVFHLHAKPIYAALGEPDNRNRRPVAPAQVARKLMVLDYVLSEPAVPWIATEQEKVALFRDRLGIPEQDLPRRRYRATRPTALETTRYFVDKLPVGACGDPLSVRFVYLVTDTTGAGVEAFLRDHARLLSRLVAWTLVLVCPRHIDGLRQAEAAFRRFVFATATGITVDEELRWFFRTRQLVESERLQDVSVPDLARFRQVRARFHTARYEALYASWGTLGDAVFQSTRAVTSGAHLHAQVLPFRYDEFGSLQALA